MEFNPHLEIPLDEFMKKNVNLIHHILAKKFKHLVLNGRFEYEDLLSMASIGMIKAYRQFDPTKFNGTVTRFSTYGVPMIIGEVQRYIRDDNPGLKFPRRAKEISYRIHRYEWYDESKEFIRDKINAENMSTYQAYPITVEDVKMAFEYITFGTNKSMEETVRMGDDEREMTIADTQGKEADYSAVFVEDFLAHLPLQHRTILELRMDDVGQYDIGKQVGISQVQVSRIIKALGPKLQKYLKNGFFDQSKKKSKGDVIDMGRPLKGDKDEAIRLLISTYMTYNEIAKQTGVSSTSVRKWSDIHHTKEKRQAITAKITQERIGRMNAARNKLLADTQSSPVYTFTEQPKQEAGRAYHVTEEEKISPPKQTPITTLGGAIEQYREEVKKEVKDEMTPKGQITRKVSFNYEADGQEIPVEIMLEELQDLIDSLKGSNNRSVNFNISVNAF